MPTTVKDKLLHCAPPSIRTVSFGRPLQVSEAEYFAVDSTALAHLAYDLEATRCEGGLEQEITLPVV